VKKILVIAGILLATFVASASLTLAAPPCNKCRKDGCPSGYCYVDCVGCCFFHPQYGVVCFR